MQQYLSMKKAFSLLLVATALSCAAGKGASA
jgi:hypothetical protein